MTLAWQIAETIFGLNLVSFLVFLIIDTLLIGSRSITTLTLGLCLRLSAILLGSVGVVQLVFFS